MSLSKGGSLLRGDAAWDRVVQLLQRVYIFQGVAEKIGRVHLMLFALFFTLGTAKAAISTLIFLMISDWPI